jgi:hypothetical protein
MEALNYFFSISRIDWLIIPTILFSFLFATGLFIFVWLTAQYAIVRSPLFPHPRYATVFKFIFLAVALFAIAKSFVVKEDDIITSTYYQDLTSVQRDTITQAVANHSPFISEDEIRLMDLMLIIY